jgi:hypothetical protein
MFIAQMFDAIPHFGLASKGAQYCRKFHQPQIENRLCLSDT